jgi:hypothetical protein
MKNNTVQNPEYLLLRFKQAEEVIYECFEFIEGLCDGAPDAGPIARSANHLMAVLGEAGYTSDWAEVHAGETLPNDGKEVNQMRQDIEKLSQRMRRLLREIDMIHDSIATLRVSKTDCSETIARLESDLQAARADLAAA